VKVGTEGEEEELTMVARTKERKDGERRKELGSKRTKVNSNRRNSSQLESARCPQPSISTEKMSSRRKLARMEEDDGESSEGGMDRDLDEDPSQWGFGEDQQDDEADEWARNSGELQLLPLVGIFLISLVGTDISYLIASDQTPTPAPSTLDPGTNDDLNEVNLKDLDWEKLVLPDLEELLDPRMERGERKGWMI